MIDLERNPQYHDIEQTVVLQQENPQQIEVLQQKNIKQTPIIQIFQELEDIKQFSISGNIQIQTTMDLCLCYFNFTQDQYCYNNLLQLINLRIINHWEKGFLGKVNETKFFAYFQNLIENNNNNNYSEVINYCELTKIKLFLKSFLKSDKFKRLNFVVQLKYEQNLVELSRKIKHRIHQLFEGFFEEIDQQEIIIFCLLSSQENVYQGINLNIKEEKFYSIDEQAPQNQEVLQNEQLIQIDISQINIEYFNLISNNRIRVIQKEQYFKQIGYSCNQYIQNKVKIVFHGFDQVLYQLIKKIKNLLELKTNLKGEANSNKNIKKYLDDLKQLIGKIKDIISKQIETLDIQELIQSIKNTVIQYSEIIKKDLNDIKDMQDMQGMQNMQNMQNMQDISIEIENYLTEQQTNILYFNVDFTQNQISVLNYFKEYYIQVFIQETLKIYQISLIFWFNHFEHYIPQRLSYIRSYFVNQSESQSNNDSQNVVVLGITKVGKTTLINILRNPNNMKLVEKREKKYIFAVIKQDNNFEISHNNNSKTSSTNDLKIESHNSNFILIDTPGFEDTCQENRLKNQISMFLRLQKSKQFVILFLIDGELLCDTKNNLIESIQLTNLFFGQQLNTACLEQILIPVFTKVSEAIMKEIIKEWENSTMKDCSIEVKEFLKVIKNKIDNNEYISIQKAESYFISNLEKLKEEEKQIYQQIFEKPDQIALMMDKLSVKKQQINELENNKQNIKYEIINSKINEIRECILYKCQLLFDQQREQQQVQINFKFSLTPSMKKSFEISLNQLSQLNSYVDDVISNVIINNILNEERSLEEIQKLLQYLLNSLEQFDQQHLDSSQLWLKCCQYLNLPPKTAFLDEYLSQIKIVHDLYQNSTDQQIQIQQQEFQKLKQHINLLQSVVTEVEDTINRIIENRNQTYSQVLINISLAFFEFGALNIVFYHHFTIITPLVAVYTFIRQKINGMLQEDYEIRKYNHSTLTLIYAKYHQRLNFIPI